jgi:CubicO group peptidase (beta-lactamase class C family)
VTNALLCLAITRGYAKYNDPISKYWPEFGINGKQHITIEQLVSHQAGLAAVDGNTRIDLAWIARAQVDYLA